MIAGDEWALGGRLLGNGQVIEQGDWYRESLYVGFCTGTGIPMVFPKWVTRVRVWYWILAHCAHHIPIPQCHGYSRVNYLVVVSFLCIIFIAIF